MKLTDFLLEGYLIVPRMFIRLLDDDVWTAAFLSQAIYWSNQSEDGWFYKTPEEWEKEIGISKKNLERAQETLKTIGVLETRTAKVNDVSVCYCRIIPEKLEQREGNNG